MSSERDLAKIESEVAQWKPQYQEELAQRLEQAKVYKPFYCPVGSCDGFPHVVVTDGPATCSYPYADGHHPWDPDAPRSVDRVWTCPACKAKGTPTARGSAAEGTWLHHHARPDQRPPRWDDDWSVLVWMGGRGSGKTFGATKFIHQWTKKVPNITIIGPTGTAIRRYQIEGDSGLLATASPDTVPLWESSKQELTWPNGCKGYVISAEEPDRIRGMNAAALWLDEPAHYSQIDEVWTQIRLALRNKGFPIRTLATTTPKPIPWLKKLLKSPKTRAVKVSTYRNLHNLNDEFRETILDQYEGTRIGRQELYGEMLDDNTGALFRVEDFQYPGQRAPKADPATPVFGGELPMNAPTRAELVRVGIGVDPAGSTSARADETGIVVGGLDRWGRLWVLEDATGKYSPNGWANKVSELAKKWHADVIVAERNYGGQMVEAVLSQVEIRARLITVHSRAGKMLRAEPVAGRYEQHRVWHVKGLTKFEAELTDWVPGISASPNALDAWVHLATELDSGRGGPVVIENPADLTWDSIDTSEVEAMFFTDGLNPMDPMSIYVTPGYDLPEPSPVAAIEDIL